MWEKAAVAYSELASYSGIRLEDLRKKPKISVKVLDLRAQIWNQGLPNMKQESYLLDVDVRGMYGRRIGKLFEEKGVFH